MDGEVVLSTPEARHAAALTRETVTPAAHSVRFGFTEAQVAAFRDAVEAHRDVVPPRLRGPDDPATGRAEGTAGSLLGTTKSLPLG